MFFFFFILRWKEMVSTLKKRTLYLVKIKCYIIHENTKSQQVYNCGTNKTSLKLYKTTKYYFSIYSNIFYEHI